MTQPEDRDPALEALLRSTLAAEADGVTPRGDGLTRIQQRVNARRVRRAWMRPLAVVGALAVAGGAAFAGFAATHRHNGGDDSLLTSHSPSPTGLATELPSPSPTPATASASPAFPDAAFYPFASAAAEKSWEDNGGASSQPSYTDPLAVAKSFVRDYVGASSVSLVLGQHIGTGVANVTLGRTMNDGTSQRDWPVTVVRLVKYGAAWVVVGADDANSMLKVTSPAAGDAVSTPVRVTGPSYGVDESIRVEVRGPAGSVTTTPGQASFGDGAPPWSATVKYDARNADRGAVVVTENSAADGNVGRIAVVGVSFSNAADVSYPSYFYGVKNGRVTKFSARNGAALTYLTAPDGVASDPQRVGDVVYYVYTHQSCGNPNVLTSIATTGGSSTTIAVAQPGYTIAGYGVSPDGTRVSLWETACDATKTSPQGLLVDRVLASHTSHSIGFANFPPMVVDDPVWEPDGTHVDAVVRTGNMATLQRFDAFNAADANAGQPACGNQDWGNTGLPQAVGIDGSGDVWVASESGGGIVVTHCTGGGAQNAFTIPAAQAGAQDLSVTDDGRAVLVTDGTGAVWRWSGGGSVGKVTTRVPQGQVSW